MKCTVLSLALLLAFVNLVESAYAANPTAAATTRTHAPLKLQARVSKHFTSRNWGRCSAAEIKSSFEYSCAAGSCDRELVLELPKEMKGIFAAQPGEDTLYKVEPKAGSRPVSMHFRTLRRWRHHVLFALQQLEWELLTDSAQGVRKLGPYYGGEENWAQARWNETPKIRKFIDIDYENKAVNEAGIMTVPALGYRKNFQGTAKLLLVFHHNRKVDVKLLESTLSQPVSFRLVESMKSLNGHPVAELPRDQVDVDQIPVVCTMYFFHDYPVKKPVHKDVMFGIGHEEFD